MAQISALAAKTGALHATVPHLLDSPESFEITATEGAQSIMIVIVVAKNDIPKLVGKLGRNIEALKTLSHAIGAKNGFRVCLFINE